MTLVVGSFSLVGTLTFWAKDADAIPVFARKYGMSCNSCHTMFPKLTKMGVAFRERGFRFAAGKDDLDSQDDRGKNFDTDDSPAAVFAVAWLPIPEEVIPFRCCAFCHCSPDRYKDSGARKWKAVAAVRRYPADTKLLNQKLKNYQP